MRLVDGELHVRGPQLASGYWGDADASRFRDGRLVRDRRRGDDRRRRLRPSRRTARRPDQPRRRQRLAGRGRGRPRDASGRPRRRSRRHRRRAARRADRCAGRRRRAALRRVDELREHCRAGGSRQAEVAGARAPARDPPPLARAASCCEPSSATCSQLDEPLLDGIVVVHAHATTRLPRSRARHLEQLGATHRRRREPWRGRRARRLRKRPCADSAAHGARLHVRVRSASAEASSPPRRPRRPQPALTSYVGTRRRTAGAHRMRRRHGRRRDQRGRRRPSPGCTAAGSPARGTTSPSRRSAPCSTLKTILWAARTRPDEWAGTHVRSRDRARRLRLPRRATAGSRSTSRPARSRHGAGSSDELGLDAVDESSGCSIAGARPSVGATTSISARPVYEERLASLSTDDAVALIRRNGGSSVPFQTLEECLDHPQSRALGLRERGADGLPFRVDAAGRMRVAASSSRDPARPLAGVRVVDFGVGGVGPFAATLLAWLGADVVKVEAPNEFILFVRPTVGGLSTTYLALNQGKRSVQLDLKDDDDRELARGLVADADVVLENFRPGALDRIGFGFEELSRAQPATRLLLGDGLRLGRAARGRAVHRPAHAGVQRLRRGRTPTRPASRGACATTASSTSSPRPSRPKPCARHSSRARRSAGRCASRRRCSRRSTHVLQASRTSTAQELDGLYGTRDGDLAVTCRSVEERAALMEVLGVSTLERPRARGGSGSAPGCGVGAAPGRARGVPAVQTLRDEDVLARADFRDTGLLRDLPLPHAAPLVAGGPPWELGGRDDAPPAPSPGSGHRAAAPVARVVLAATTGERLRKCRQCFVRCILARR